MTRVRSAAFSAGALALLVAPSVRVVKYAIDNRNGNPDRVYATGDSSGGMMTELLLALYPDVFKAGAAQP